MEYDSLFMPFKHKSSTNPRYETLYKILVIENNKIRTNDVVVTVDDEMKMLTNKMLTIPEG